jgi:hypothetical protein
MGLRHPLLLALVLVTAALSTAPAALARGGDDGGGDGRVRTTGICSGALRAALEARAKDGEIELRLDVRGARRGSSWRVTISQEGRVAWRGRARARGGSGAFRVRRSLRDLVGADRLTVRAAGPGGASCRASATLPGD